MGADTGADQFKPVFDNAVDQYKVGFNMAVAESGVIAFERVVSERGRKGCPVAKELDDTHDLLQILASPNRPPDIALKGCRIDRGEHGGQSFMMSANISSVLSNGPYIGSVPARTRSRTARVSALGYSFASSSSVRS